MRLPRKSTRCRTGRPLPSPDDIATAPVPHHRANLDSVAKRAGSPTSHNSVAAAIGPIPSSSRNVVPWVSRRPPSVSTGTEQSRSERRELHADSNVFLDRPSSNTSVRLIFDGLYLSDPTLDLFVSASAISEVLPNDIFGTQRIRLIGRPGGAVIIPVADAVTDTSGLPIGNFDENDARIVNTSIVAGLPLLTANIRMPNQISSNPLLTERFGSARFELVS